MRSTFRIYLVIIISIFVINSIQAQKKIACIGNSITYGYGLSSPSTQSYPSKLQDLLGSEYEVHNFGVSARTLLKRGDRPYWNESAYSQALNLQPDIVIIMLGTNDAKLNTNWTPHKDEFKSDYQSMIRAFEGLASNPKVWICQIVPAYQTIWEISDATIKNEVNPKIKEVSEEEGFGLLDMYSAMSNKANMFLSDGIHPNATGAEEMANYIHQVLLQDTLNIQHSGDTLVAPVGVGYQWYLDGQLIDESAGGQNRTFVANESGSYEVRVQLDESSQTAILSSAYDFEKEIYVEPLFITESQMVNIYPNPCKEYITVKLDNKFSSQQIQFRIYNNAGQLYHSTNIDADGESTHIDIQSFENDVYLYLISADGETIESGKFIVDR